LKFIVLYPILQIQSKIHYLDSKVVKNREHFALLLTNHRLWGSLIIPYIISTVNKNYFRLSECLSPFQSEDTIGYLADEEREIVKKFQDDPSNMVFLISLKTGGLGLNLTAADYVFILDPWWNPAAELQARDRAHRIGQGKSVFVYKYISTGTIEEKIIRLQENKSRLADLFVRSSNPLQDFDIKQILDLIS
jgi:hypothetical protein